MLLRCTQLIALSQFARLLTCTLFFGSFLAVVPARADIPYEDPSNQGTQSWGGNLGLNFTVITPITVTQLGVFNAAGNGVITGPIKVAIFDFSTSQVVTPVVTFEGSYTPAGLGYDVFQSITPVTLAAGSYQVDAFGFGTDLNGNLNTGSSTGPILNNLGGAIVFTGASWDYDTSSLDYPTTCIICQGGPSPQNQQFDAGTFAVPEPSEIVLLLSLITALGLTSVLGRKLRAIR